MEVLSVESYKEQEIKKMTTRKEIIDFCLTFDNVFEDYPFHDDNW